jgi:hypothetical protein
MAAIFTVAGGWQPSRGDDHSEFGTSLSASGDLVAIGADYDAAFGAAYVYRWEQDHWKQIVRMAPSRSTKPGFGKAIAIERRTVVAGHVLQDVGGRKSVGAAYVFEGDGDSIPAVESQILTAPKPTQYSGFGESVAISRQLIAVGAPSDDNGAVYLFRKKGSKWESVGKLTGVDSPRDRFGALFGRSLAMTDRFLVVGAPLQPDSQGERTGALYVYRRDADGMVSEPAQILTALPDDQVAELGFTVAVHESSILAGAPGSWGRNSTQLGGAVLFSAGADGTFPERPVAIYRAPESTEDERAGTVVALSRDLVLVGAPLRSNHQGGVYVYSRKNAGGKLLRRLDSEASQGAANFGRALAVTGERLLVGSPGFNSDGQVVSYPLEPNGPGKPGRSLTRHTNTGRSGKN